MKNNFKFIALVIAAAFTISSLEAYNVKVTNDLREPIRVRYWSYAFGYWMHGQVLNTYEQFEVPAGQTVLHASDIRNICLTCPFAKIQVDVLEGEYTPTWKNNVIDQAWSPLIGDQLVKVFYKDGGGYSFSSKNI